MRYPDSLNELIDAFKSFPGIGRRSAERIVFAVLKWPDEKQKAVGELFSGLNSKVAGCPECGNIADAGNKCVICADASRNRSVICVVETFPQIASIESSGFYRGVYHVLGGRIAPLDGKGPEDLNIDTLRDRIVGGGVSEIILALAQDVEGRATAIYIADILKNMEIKITRLASGLPAGSDISYADAATVAAALDGRTVLE